MLQGAGLPEVVVLLQKALDFLYPSQCVTCNAIVESSGLCGSCWRETPFITGLVCDKCGVPLPGDDGEDADVLCDSCMLTPRPWNKGRAALVYNGNARKLVLSLKHSDRTELAEPAAAWMASAARQLIGAHTLIAPVPLHWSRLIRRRYNQSALLATALARETGSSCCADLLVRKHKTPRLEGKSATQRFDIMSDSVYVHPHRRIRITGRPVLLVDDVMTSGATLAACAEACKAGGASIVHTVVLARVAKDA